MPDEPFKDLEEFVMQDMRRTYSEKVIDHFLNPRNLDQRQIQRESLHCALLAANTLKEAFRDYLAFKNEPWKRSYRKP